MVKNSKKGVSIMVGYIVLISIAIAISAMVYGWIKTYTPKDIAECPDGVSISIEEAVCTGGAGNYNLNLKLKNNGRFDIAGYFIYATDSATQELATKDLSEKRTSGGGNFGGAMLFGVAGENPFKPNDERTENFNIPFQIFSVEILPVRWQKFENKNAFVSCGRAKVRENVDC